MLNAILDQTKLEGYCYESEYIFSFLNLVWGECNAMQCRI